MGINVVDMSGNEQQKKIEKPSKAEDEPVKLKSIVIDLSPRQDPAMLVANLAFAPPSPKCSSVIVKSFAFCTVAEIILKACSVFSSLPIISYSAFLIRLDNGQRNMSS